MNGCNKTIRATLASGFAIVLGFAAAGQTAIADDNGRCPAYTATIVDEEFLKWSEEVDFDPILADIYCTDIAGSASMAIDVQMFGDRFVATVNPSAADPADSYRAQGFAYPNDDEDTEIWGQAELLTVGQGYVCRSEILRSFTWRQYCGGNSVYRR